MAASRIVLAAALLLAGCSGYDPPMAGAHDTVRYQTDLRRCRKEADAKATRLANRTPETAAVALFSSDEPERQDVLACMKTHGYVQR